MSESKHSIEQQLEKVLDNWSKFIGLVEKISNDEIRTGLLSLCVELKDRISVCPASTRTDYIGAYMGGLVETALHTTKLMNSLNKAYDEHNRVDLDSIIICGLFSQLGKIGTEKEDLYTPNESQWHNDRGMMFDYNTKISAVPVTTRSLWWITSSGIRLSESEIHAITSLGTMGQVVQSQNEIYGTSLLAAMLQHATQVVSITSTRGKTSVLS